MKTKIIMTCCDCWFEVAFVMSFIANFSCALILIGCFIKPRKPKKPKNIELANIYLALLIGYLGGIIGNAFITSLFEIDKQYLQPWFFPVVLLVTGIFTAIFIFWIVRLIRESLDD